jgi:hypothetical protein
MKLNVKKATTSFICHVFIQDNTSTAGAGLTGLDNTKVVLYYMRAGASAAVAVTLDASSGVTLGTYEPTDNAHGAIKEVDATHMPGVYELHLPNNALASGANQVVFLLSDAGSNKVTPLPLEIQLVSYDPNDANGLGLARLDAAVTTRAAASTALSNAIWTDTKAGYLDAAVTSRAPAATALTNATWTDAKAAYLDAAISGRAAEAGGNVAAILADTDQLQTRLANMIEADGADWRFKPNAVEGLFLVNLADVEDAAPQHSLTTVCLAIAVKSNTKAHAGKLTVFKTDGSEKVQIPISTDAAAAPVDGIG